jgi:hypothetical protein
MTKIKIKLFTSISSGLLGLFCLYNIYNYLPMSSEETLSIIKFEKIKTYINKLSASGCKDFYKVFKLNPEQNLVRSNILDYKVVGGVKNIQISNLLKLRVINMIVQNNPDYRFSLYFWENTFNEKCYGSVL